MHFSCCSLANWFIVIFVLQVSESDLFFDMQLEGKRLLALLTLISC